MLKFNFLSFLTLIRPSSPYQFVFIVVFTLLLIALLVLGIFLIIYFLQIKNYRKSLVSGKNNVRIYSIHYNENKVLVFDKHNLKNHRSHDLSWLYESVSQSDQLRLKVWLSELKRVDHKVPHHIEIHVYIKGIRQNIFSVLEVSSINYEKGIIHLISHLFPNINKIKKDKNTQIYIKEEAAMPKIIEDNHTNSVALYNIRLFSTYEFDSDQVFRPDHIIMTQIMNRLAKFATNSRYLSLLKTNEICICDFSIQNTNGAIALGHNFSKEVSRILFLNGLQKKFSFKIGVVFDKNHSKTFLELSKTAKEMSIFAEDNNIQSTVILFDKFLNYRQLSQNTIVDNIKNVITKDEIAYKYTSIIDGRKGGLVLGYYVELIPKRSLLSSFQEVQEYAYKNDMGDKLMKLILNNIKEAKSKLPGTDVIEDDSLIFIDIQVPYVPLILSLLKEEELASLAKNIVLVFEDNDVQSFSQESDITSVLSSLKEANILFALLPTKLSLDLSSELTKLFDYFIIDENIFQDLLSNSKHQILFQDLIQKLSSYNKELIGVNIASWQSFEYYIRQHITCYSTDILGYSFDTLPVIDEKKLNKSIDIFNAKSSRL